MVCSVWFILCGYLIFVLDRIRLLRNPYQPIENNE